MDLIQPLWIISAVIAIAKSNDDRWPSKFPLNLRKFIEKQELCEFGYADCDNYVTMGLAKRYRIFGDLYHYFKLIEFIVVYHLAEM